MILAEDKAFLFLDSLQEQLSLYRRILAGSSAQTEMVRSGDENRLLEWMKEKQVLIDRIAELSQQFAPERKLLEAARAPGEFSILDVEIDRVLAETEALLQALVECETRDMETLTGHRESYSKKMDQIAKGRDMAKAYLRPKASTSLEKQV